METAGRVERWNKQEISEDRVTACHYANEVSQGNPRNMMMVLHFIGPWTWANIMTFDFSLRNQALNM